MSIPPNIARIVEKELKVNSSETKENIIKRVRKSIEDKGTEWTPELEAKIRKIYLVSN